MGIKTLKNDFIDYPLRTEEKDLLCRCKHAKGEHNGECFYCMCPKYTKSKMNGQIEKEISKALEEARPQAIINGTNKYSNGIRKPET